MRTKTKVFFTSLVVLMLLVGFTGVALAFDSGDKPTTTGANTITWTGQGGLGEPEVYCGSDEVPDDFDPDSYLHWILTTDGGSADTAVLYLGGNGSGSYDGSATGGAFHFFTPYSDLDGLSASANINILETGNGAWILTISHGCGGDNDYEELTVDKTANTSFTRTHDWSIDKSVDPTDLYLYIPGQGDLPSTGTANWTVDVTYEGYEDSDWNVSGAITIENTGTLDARITGVTDSLFDADCGVTFPYDLAVGSTLTCTYSYDGYIEGINEVYVTTERGFTYYDSAAIVWGDPTTEINKTVEIRDTLEGLLGTLTAPNGERYSYSTSYDWEDYGDDYCGNRTIVNTAEVIGDEGQLDYATAYLYVHVQCHVYETAYGKGTSPTCFIPTFSNWGWTNSISPFTTQTWNLWAGAAQCDTTKGTLVGTVSVTYGAAYVHVSYNVQDPYILSETHVYAGTNPFPMVKVGKNKVATVAPGMYTNVGPFSGPVYVIAHAVVGIPDPNFP